MTDQQTSHWITLTIVFSVGLIILLCNLKSTKDHRSLAQWVILQLYKVIRFLWAIVRAIDVAYLEYRHIVKNMPLEIENERVIGMAVKKPVKASVHEKPATGELGWQPAARSSVTANYSLRNLFQRESA